MSRIPLIENRDLEAARDAYKSGDIHALKSAHNLGVDNFAHEEKHLDGSKEKLKSFVFGGLDGIVTIFCVLAGCMGAKLTPQQIMIVGLGNLLGDAVSMGFGEYVSSKTEDEFQESELRREAWEMQNCPEGEKAEMIELYQNKYSFSESDARAMVELGWKYPEFFLNHMMVEELGLLVEAEAGVSPREKGVIMFSAFVLFGSVPLFSFAIFEWLAGGYFTDNTAFLFACFLSGMSLFLLGSTKARFVNQNPVSSGTIMLMNGAIAGSIAYSCGALLQNFMGVSL